jgi:hypothetical protein
MAGGVWFERHSGWDQEGNGAQVFNEASQWLAVTPSRNM